MCEKNQNEHHKVKIVVRIRIVKKLKNWNCISRGPCKARKELEKVFVALKNTEN